MHRLSSTTRWLITALLAVWMPFCCCEASGLLRMALGAAGNARGDGGGTQPTCCCSDSGHTSDESPRNDDRTDPGCGDECCNLGPKLTGAERPDLPDLGGGAPLPPPVALAAVALPALPIPAPAEHGAAPAPAPTLLRLHCALTI